MGSDISWKCLGGDKFLINLTVYRDCKGCRFDNKGQCGTRNCPMPKNLKVTSTCGILNVPLEHKQYQNVTDQLTCPSACNACSDCYCAPPTGLPYGVERHEFEAVMDLSEIGCCKYKLGFSIADRNSAITTGPEGNFYIEAMLNKCITPCNSSPVFSTDPIAIICTGQCLAFNQGATDPDGDSLVYSLTVPMNYPEHPVYYRPPYSYKKPLYFDGMPDEDLSWDPPDCKGFHLDSASGDLFFRPTRNEVTVMAVLVQEYRDGELIGEVRRDMQIIVMSCPENAPPSPSTNQFNYIACPGKTLTINIPTTDINPSDRTSITWDTAISDATWTTIPGKYEKGIFTWTPKESDVRNVAYYFNVIIKDDACPLYGVTIRSFRIMVQRDKAEYQIIDNGCKNFTFKVKNSTPPGVPVEWSVDGIVSTARVFTHQFQEYGSHPVALSVDGGCPNTYNDTLVIQQNVNVNAYTADGQNQYCINDDPVELIGTPPGGTWSGEGISQGSFNPAAAGAGSFILEYRFQDAHGCWHSASLDVMVQLEPTVKIISGDTVCPGGGSEIQAMQTGAEGISWATDGDGALVAVNPSSVSYTPGAADLAADAFTITAITTGNGACQPASDQKTFGIYPNPQADFVADTSEGCPDLPVRFTDLSSVYPGSIAQWKWNFGDGAISDERNPAHIFQNPGSFDVSLEVVTDRNCRREITRPAFIKVFLEPKANFLPLPETTTIAMPHIKFENRTADTSNPAFHWNFGDFENKTDGGISSNINPVYTYNDTGIYSIRLWVINDNGCEDSFRRRVFIEPDIAVYVPNAFAPSGLNKEFRVICSSVGSFHLQVYDRWGALLFETDDHERGWDGQYREQPVPEGVYMYVVKATNYAGKPHTYTGTLTLLR